jgi:hypothetical protein
VQVDDDEEDRVQITARYAGDFVESVFSADGESRTEDGEVQQNACDRLSEVFLLRTLAFEEGREFAFNSVFAARYDAPDNTAAAALAMTVAAGGGCRAARTTVLMTPQEAQQAMAQASATGYKPPS